MTRLAALALSLLVLLIGAAAAPGAESPVVVGGATWPGVNLPSGSFNASGSRLEFDYTYPTEADIDYYTGKGLKVFRISFLAKRLVAADAAGALATSSDMAILSRLIDYAASKGALVILDMHDYGLDFSGKVIGRDPGSIEDFAASWATLARAVADKPNVVFGLMNEPNQQTAAEWLPGANAAIAAIRNAGAKQLILVPGSHWDSAHTWTSTDNAEAMTGVSDPGRNFAYEVHQYLDADNSGSHATALPGSGATRLAAFTEWARTHGVRGFLGEFGWAANTPAQKEGNDLLCYMHRNQDVWLGWTYWAGGPWWGDYMYSVEPKDGMDRPQMKVLSQFARPGATPQC
jgi:endoglucanase